MQMFYTDQIFDQHAVFAHEEMKHLTHSLRKKEGDSIFFTDGKGNAFSGLLDTVSRHEATVRIVEKVFHPPIEPAFQLLIAPTKQHERIELIVEKATEMGIQRITPVSVKHAERTSIRQDRLEKVAISAMKQSLQYHLPVIDPLTDFDTILKNPYEGISLIGYCEGEDRKTLSESIVKGSPARCFIGPEGDFTEKEVSKALAAGFVKITLGQSRLRTETAAIFVCAAFKLIQEF